jgi:hypothetical protein
MPEKIISAFVCICMVLLESNMPRARRFRSVPNVGMKSRLVKSSLRIRRKQTFPMGPSTKVNQTSCIRGELVLLVLDQSRS